MLFSFLFFISVLIDRPLAASLYGDTPYVVEVSEIPPRGSCPWFLVLYVGWCGHCHAFAPVYSKFATVTFNDTFGSVVAAIDCVQHDAVCRKHARGYPTVMYYDGVNATQITATLESMAASVRALALHDPAVQRDCRLERTRQFELSIKYRRLRGNGKIQWYNPHLSFEYSLQHEALNRSGAYQTFVYHAHLALPMLKGSASKDGTKGCNFPCGLWRLYHSMLEGPEPLPALRAICDYVTTFFSCVSCRRHFTEMVRESLADVRDGREARLWLWRAHNKVNARLKYPFFPPREKCPSCDTDDDKALSFLHEWYGTQASVVSVKKIRVLPLEKASDSWSWVLFLVVLLVAMGVWYGVCRRRFVRRG